MGKEVEETRLAQEWRLARNIERPVGSVDYPSKLVQKEKDNSRGGYWVEDQKTGDDPAAGATDLDALGIACVEGGDVPRSALGGTGRGTGPACPWATLADRSHRRLWQQHRIPEATGMSATLRVQSRTGKGACLTMSADLATRPTRQEH